MNATPRGGRRLPLCDDHLGITFDVGLTMKHLTPAGDALGALLDVYGVEDLASFDATVEDRALPGESTWVR